jgi:polar amino acid transport system substrate-binding protein
VRINDGPDQQRVVPAKVDAIADRVPAAIRTKGKLAIGVGAAGSGFPPLAFIATDNKTLIGSEPDVAVAVAGIQGKIALTTKKGNGLVGGVRRGGQ